VVTVPPNPDNQIESIVIQENIKLQRMSAFLTKDKITKSATELSKVIARSTK
jgi:hypothetical protein